MCRSIDAPQTDKVGPTNMKNCSKEATSRLRRIRERNGGRPPRVAVIGTGMAGETAIYFLSAPENANAATIARVYEARHCPGLHVNSIVVGDCHVDVPLRAISPHYYANLFQLYKHLGISLQPVDYSSSTSVFGATEPKFRYQNVLVCGKAFPLLIWQDLRNMTKLMLSLVLLRDLFYLVCAAPFLLSGWTAASRRVRSKSLGHFLRTHNFNYQFTHEFLYPMLSTILSCSYTQVDEYPAQFILEFFASRWTTLLTGWFRVQQGVQQVSSLLLANVARADDEKLRSRKRDDSRSSAVGENDDEILKFNAPIRSVVYDSASDEVRVTECDGSVRSFDIVVIATEPSTAQKIWLGRTEEEDALLKSLKHYTANITVHSDQTLMPPNKEDWRGMNVFHADHGSAGTPQKSKPASADNSPLSASMTSARLSMYHARLQQGEEDNTSSATTSELIETWNAFKAPDKESIVHDVCMTRAVWDMESKEAFEEHFLKCQGTRGIFLIGAFAEPGVTLLEQAVTSGCKVAEALGATVPFPVKPCYEQSTVVIVMSALFYGVVSVVSRVLLLVRRLFFFWL